MPLNRGMKTLLRHRRHIISHRHWRMLHRHQHQIGAVTALGNHGLYGIGNKHQLAIYGNRRTQQDPRVGLISAWL